MRVSVPQASLKRLLRSLQIALLTGGAGMLGYCAFVLADTWIYQKQASRMFDTANLRPAPLPGPAADAATGLLGRMEIPRLGISMIVAEGTSEAILRRAGGHIAGTALPGDRARALRCLPSA